MSQQTTVLAAVDDLLLRASAALPSSDPQDMHLYATKSPSQPYLQEIISITQSISNALLTTASTTDSKVIALLREHATHDQIVFERQDLNRRALELLQGQAAHWVEDVPLEASLKPDFVLTRVERWAKDARMEVYQSIENGLNSLTCAGSAVVLDMLFEKTRAESDTPGIKLVSLKSSYPTSSESAPVTQPLTTVDALLSSGISAYVDEVLYEGADAQKAAQLALRVIEHIRYIMIFDAQAAREAETGGTDARWFAEVGILSPKVIDLGCKEAAGLCSQLGAPKAPLDIFLRRAHALPLINLNSPSISFLIGIAPIVYLSLLKASSQPTSATSFDPQPNVDIPIVLLRHFVTQHPTPPGITTCNLILTSCNQLPSPHIPPPPPPRAPQFSLLEAPPVGSLGHSFPIPGGNSAWVLDFGAKGLVMRRSAMQALVQALGHVEDADALPGIGFMNLGGLMSEESGGWVGTLLQKPPGSSTQQLYAVQTSPTQLHPPLHLSMRPPPEAGFVLGRVRVQNMAEVWTTLEIVREQCWLNNTIASYDWSDSPPQHTDTPEQQGLTSLLSGKFLSIPTQLSISTGPASPSVLLQFPIPPKRASNSNQAPVPSVVQLMVSYDPTASRGTHVQFGSLDPHVNVAETLDGFKDRVDEVVRRAGPLAAVGWLHAQLRSV